MKVYVERHHCDYMQMFAMYGHEPVADVGDADVVQFVGGADINPKLYGRGLHPTTRYNDPTDESSLNLYEYAQNNSIPCAGICRGSQFLHAMAGGELVQDCDGHGVARGHMAKLHWMPNTEILVSSTHHQMMYSDDVGEVLITANSISTYKETVKKDGEIEKLSVGTDIEAMYYESINAISFQPHPEFVIHDNNYKECADAYFFILKNYLGLE